MKRSPVRSDDCSRSAICRNCLTWLATALATLALALVQAGAAQAVDKPKPTPEEAYKKLDKNSDARVTEEEFLNKRKGKAVERAKKEFARIDTNSDGWLTLDEFRAGWQQK